MYTWFEHQSIPGGIHSHLALRWPNRKDLIFKKAVEDETDKKKSEQSLLARSRRCKLSIWNIVISYPYKNICSTTKITIINEEIFKLFICCFKNDFA